MKFAMEPAFRWMRSQRSCINHPSPSPEHAPPLLPQLSQLCVRLRPSRPPIAPSGLRPRAAPRPSPTERRPRSTPRRPPPGGRLEFRGGQHPRRAAPHSAPAPERCRRSPPSPGPAELCRLQERKTLPLLVPGVQELWPCPALLWPRTPDAAEALNSLRLRGARPFRLFGPSRPSFQVRLNIRAL